MKETILKFWKACGFSTEFFLNGATFGKLAGVPTDAVEHFLVDMTAVSLIYFPFHRIYFLRQIAGTPTLELLRGAVKDPLKLWNGNFYRVMATTSKFSMSCICGNLMKEKKMTALDALMIIACSCAIAQPFNSLMIRKCIDSEVTIAKDFKKISLKTLGYGSYFTASLFFGTTFFYSVCLANKLVPPMLTGVLNLAAYPVDTVYHRLLAESFKPLDDRKYKSISDCCSKILREEGWRGFSSLPYADVPAAFHVLAESEGCKWSERSLRQAF